MLKIPVREELENEVQSIGGRGEGEGSRSPSLRGKARMSEDRENLIDIRKGCRRTPCLTTSVFLMRRTARGREAGNVQDRAKEGRQEWVQRGVTLALKVDLR